ncbi:hypothetical protein EYF80_050694 [Liparis tanakae]|uniref:Uncharacterized protein n=1 Tax=Liparis tanakae TaxID=230148 RepID=A0A4Z2FE02_9TELE|nr:hypothetical protein EYF80_050694 [Liparis tanakae]
MLASSKGSLAGKLTRSLARPISPRMSSSTACSFITSPFSKISTMNCSSEPGHETGLVYSRSPAQSYQCAPSSSVMSSCPLSRAHSAGLVLKNNTGSFRTLHHSQLTSSEARRQMFSTLSR